MPEPFSVLIVGCGNIAGGFDEQGPTDHVLTHAGAYRRHPGFEVVACVEPNRGRRQAFMSHWGVAVGFPDMDSCLADGFHVDVASICLPTVHHAEALKA